MFPMRGFLKRHPLALGFTAAVTPLVVLLGLQYLWLAKLQETSALAHTAYLSHYLEAVTTRVDYFYRTSAERSLNVPAALFRDFDPDDMARYFKKRPIQGAREIFIVHFVGDNRGVVLYYDPYVRTMRSKNEGSDEWRAIWAACAPLAVLRYERSQLDSVSLTTHEQDPRTRIIVNPITDDASTLVGIAGAIVDDRYFAEVVLPREIEKSFHDFFPKNGDNELLVSVRDARGKPVYSSAGAGQDEARGDEVSLPFAFVFKDWKVGIRSRGLTPEEWARVNFGINMTLAGLLAVVLVGGVSLALRAASRELRLSQMKSTFVSNVSHELRTPLASIRVFGEFLRRGRATEPEKIREYGEFIESESRRLTQLINNILDFSRIESNRKTYEFRMADVHEIVTGVLKTLEVSLRHTGFAVEFEGPGRELPPANVDRDAVAQALNNLLDNAVKYSGDSRRIVVRLGRRRQFVTIAVQDFGIGISPSDQKKIFERFHRIADGLIHDVKGSGLGLAIVDHIVQAHGGRITVDSEPGKGSTFTIWLPAAAGEAMDAAEPAHVPAAPAGGRA